MSMLSTRRGAWAHEKAGEEGEHPSEEQDGDEGAAAGQVGAAAGEAVADALGAVEQREVHEGKEHPGGEERQDRSEHGSGAGLRRSGARRASSSHAHARRRMRPRRHT